VAQFVFHVVVLSSIYCLLGAGYVLLYRASRIVNLAYGEFVMLGGYFAFTLATLMPGQASLAILGAFIISFLTGGIIYWVLMRPMIGQPIGSAIIVTIGLSIAFRGIATLIWGSTPRYLGPVLNIENEPHFFPANIVLSTLDLATIATAIAFLGGMILFLKYVRVGVHMRAVAENPLLAAQRGINIFWVFILVWGISLVGATAAGILYGSNMKLDPEIGLIGLKALAVPIIGGMDSLFGLIPAALLVALFEIGVMKYLDPHWSEVIPLILLLFVLLLRPWGLFGIKEEIERV